MDLYRKLARHEHPKHGDQIKTGDLEWEPTGDLPVPATEDVEFRRPVRLASETERYLDEGEVLCMTDLWVDEVSKGPVHENVAGHLNRQSYAPGDHAYVARKLDDTTLVDDDGGVYSIDLMPVIDLPVMDGQEFTEADIPTVRIIRPTLRPVR